MADGMVALSDYLMAVCLDHSMVATTDIVMGPLMVAYLAVLKALRLDFVMVERLVDL